MINRRGFLTLPFVALFSLITRVDAEPAIRRGQYAADIGVLYDMLTFHLQGTIEESIDRAAGEYRVVIAGHGTSIASRIDSSGILQSGRWAPRRSSSWFNVRGRESRTEISYDYTRASIDYRARSETFFLRRVRTVEDVVVIPSGIHVDDAVSATLNYADGAWTTTDGILHTFVVRRRQAPDEGPDDVAPLYRAELSPLAARVVSEQENGKATALFDLSPFSSWMRPSRPARIVFGTNRRPELITTAMILGSSVTIRLG